MIDERAARSASRVRDRRNWMIEKQPWGWRLLDYEADGSDVRERRERTDEMIDWYLESDQYHGWVSIHRTESPFVEGSIASEAPAKLDRHMGRDLDLARRARRPSDDTRRAGHQ